MFNTLLKQYLQVILSHFFTCSIAQECFIQLQHFDNLRKVVNLKLNLILQPLFHIYYIL